MKFIINLIFILAFVLIVNGSEDLGDNKNPFKIIFNSMSYVDFQWGDLRIYEKPRNPLGLEESDPVFVRKTSIGSLSNAEFTTDEFIMPSEPLRINVDVLHGKAALTQGAYCMVEILSKKGEVLPFFEKENCVILNENKLDYLLEWQNGTTTSRLEGLTVKLKFYIRDARIYSVHTKSKKISEEVEKLILEVNHTKLEPWETTVLTLRGEDVNNNYVSLDHAKIHFNINHPNLVIAKLDKLNLHEGYLTVYDEITEPQKVTIEAILTKKSVSKIRHNVNNKIISNSIELMITPTTHHKKNSDFKMLFFESQDIVNPEGEIKFQANATTYYADTYGLPTTPTAMVCYNRKIEDDYHFWGSSRGDDGFIFKATTKDGIRFNTKKIVTSMHPNHFMSIVYSPKQNEYIAFEREYPNWYLHTSKDGWDFNYQGVAYKDHDAVNLIWDHNNNQYIANNLSFEELPSLRKYPDNITSLNIIGGRRIFTRRTSQDGKHWSPDDSVLQMYPKNWLDSRYWILVPDEQDPPDMEFYWMNTFYYGDRWVALVMTYAPSPPIVMELNPYDAKVPNRFKHGPHLNVEWCFSDDLKHWRRPYRDFPATKDWRIYFANAPMIIHDRLLFVTCNQMYHPEEIKCGQNIEVYGMPIDRIASVGSHSGGAFSTKLFVMPNTPLHINAEGTVSIEIIDSAGNIIEGFEANKCRMNSLDELHHQINWAGKTSNNLSGMEVRLRFYIEDGRLYSIHTYE
jgi:hypothetical protein